MPSAKPDMQAVLEIVKKRQLWHLQDLDLITPVRERVFSLMPDGGLDQAAATDILSWLRGQPEVARIFPNNALITALEHLLNTGGWGQEPERQVIQFIASLYTDDVDHFSLRDLLMAESSLFHGMQWLILDDAPSSGLSLSGRLCAATGRLRDMSRRQCYQFIQDRGGIPTEVTWSTDFLFIADELMNASGLSSSALAAIHQRQRRGNLQIYGESDLLRCN